MSDLRSYEDNAISIDPSNLPLDASVSTTRQVVRPSDRSGAVVDFNVSADTRPALITIRNEAGDYIQTGASAQLNDDETTIVGYDGQVYAENIAETNTLIIRQSNGENCTVTFTAPAKPMNAQRYLMPCAGKTHDKTTPDFHCCTISEHHKCECGDCSNLHVHHLDMNFGTVNLQAGGAIDTTAVLSVTCSSSLNLQLLMRVCPNLNAGSGGSSGSTRLMTNGANTLSYQFFQDANRTVLWGSSTNTTLGSVPAIDVIAPILGPGTATRTIYGRILGSQASKLAGTYLSMFSGGQARINYVRYLLGAPDCSTVADNPIQPSFNVQAIVNRSCTVSASPLILELTVL